MPDSFATELVKTIEISTTTLDTYHQQAKVDFDVLKLDIQGGELPVLKGAVEQLRDSVLAVITEVEFAELYCGQPLFADVDQFMRAHGFRLFDLDIRRWRRRALPKAFQGLRVGQTVWADALYLKDPIERDDLPRDAKIKGEKLLKLAALAECFSLPDYAMEVLCFATRLGLMDCSEETRLVDILNANRILKRRSRLYHNNSEADDG